MRNWSNFLPKSGPKKVGVLIDPDKTTAADIENLLINSNLLDADFFLVGGSLITTVYLENVCKTLKKTNRPVILFPGDSSQIVEAADALLLLSLVSGRNSEYLIGQHVRSAHVLKRSNLIIIPTGYMLVDGGKVTSVEYVSDTKPLPADKPELAEATAIASQLLGQKTIYLDAGSGAINPVPSKIIRAVANAVDVPILVGGGIRTYQQAKDAFLSGADAIIIGTAVENSPSILADIFRSRKEVNTLIFLKNNV